MRDGWDGLTTNRVAREAGVSVGSLYQYFPSKDALVHALVSDLARRLGDELVSFGPALAGAPIDECIERFVQAALHYTRVDAPLHRTVLAVLPQLGALEIFEQVNRRAADALADWIELRRGELSVADPSLTAHIIITALDALTDHALVFRPELLDSPRFERELRAMVAGCLGVARGAPEARPSPR